MPSHRATLALILTLLALGLAPVAALTTQGAALPCKLASAGMVNACATLDPSQVQDRRGWEVDTASDWPQWADGSYVCTEEDGSAPGQPFPCRWESDHGTDYTLDGPA